MNPRKNLALMALLAALAVIAAACSPADQAGTAETETDGTEATTPDGTETPTEDDVAGAQGGSYSLYIGEPESLVPANTNESEGSQVLDALFVGLIGYDPDTTETVNIMAEDITTEDAQTFEITVQDGWTFTNGEEITAQTYVDSWNFAMDPEAANANSFFFADIEGTDDAGLHDGSGAAGLEVVDDSTFTVTLKQPFSQWPLRLGYNAFVPYPTECIQEPDPCNDEPIGNGPYMIDGPWEHDVAINVVRNPDYNGEPGNADAVEFRIYSEVNTAYTDVEAGNLDVLEGVPGETVPQAKDTFGDAFVERPVSTYTYLGFPLYDERFGGEENLPLRRAISMAIDREAITDTILPQQFPADSLISPVVPGYREGACADCVFDPETARQLFDEAGGFDGTLTLWFNSGAGHELWMEAVANQLRDNLGITDIQFESREFADYLSNFADARQFTGPFRLAWGMDYPSPQNYLEPLYFTEADSNSTGYSNPEFEDLVREGNTTEDEDAAVELYQQAEDLVLADMPTAPLFFSNAAVVHSDNVSNVVVNAFQRIEVGLVEVVQ